MIKLAFGPKIEKVIENICSETITKKIIPASELGYGNETFKDNHNISDIDCSFDKLVGERKMFFNSGIKNINCKFPLLKNSERMFYNCSKLTSINIDFPNLKSANWMFAKCESLTEINTDLPKLKMANQMFFNCTKLKKFECKNMSSLIEGYNMFKNCHLLEKFEYDLPHLEGAVGMFQGCKNLKKFDSSLPMLEDATDMFNDCGKLEFRSRLPKLIWAENMFKDTQLDMEGIKIIIDSLMKAEYPYQYTIHLGIKPQGEDLDPYIKMAKNKGWIVLFQ